MGMNKRLQAWRGSARSASTLMATVLAAGMLLSGVPIASAADVANPNSDLGYPSFQGDDNPVPERGVIYDPTVSYLQQVFDKDLSNGAGSDTDDNHDFWMDRMLVRKGADPTGTGTNDAGNYAYSGADSNQYLFSRGRAAFMRTHEPGTLGFAGEIAYKDTINTEGAFSVSVTKDGRALTLREDTAQRKQTPSYWKSVFTTSDASVSVTEIKFITNENVLVLGYQFNSTEDVTLGVEAKSPLVSTVEGDELTGVVQLGRDLTTVYPRFSGDGLEATGSGLRGTVSVQAGQGTYRKIQLGLLANELPSSKTEYETVRAAEASAAYRSHVTAYNQWWVDNIPYTETPEQNIDKTVFYRWWLTRFNFIDANMPGNTYQFPAAIEGVLGYNNAIVLTTCMFINDLKYLRDPTYAYGSWVAAGETSKSAQFVDNPGGTSWNNSYTQYITDAAWESYKVHGGPSDIAESIGTYGSNDVNALVGSQNGSFNRNGNKLIDWNWASMTGNDADAVSFDEHPGEAMDRPESAWVWANARSAAEAFEAAGDTEGAAAMQQTADEIRAEILNELWNPSTGLVQSKWIGANDGDFAKWKETNNFYPYAAELMPTDGAYDDGLRLFADADQYPIFPFFTANQADKAEMIAETGNTGSNNFSVINSTPLFSIYAAGLRSYNSEEKGYITADSYKKLLYWNAFAHYQGGDNRYPDQNEFWNTATDENGGEINYRSWIHHTQLGTTNWTIIEDVAGLTARSDDKIELNPIEIPDWDYFTVNNLRYHDQDVSIVWNAKGDNGDLHYANTPEGYSLYIDGKRVFTSDKLTHIIYDSKTGTAEVTGDNGDRSAVITAGDSAAVAEANTVTYASDSRVTDIFAKAGKNIDPASASNVNVVQGATVTASYETDGYPASAAVDGTTINEPFWGTSGSNDTADTLTVDFGDTRTIDDIRLYFYKTAANFTVQGYAEPSIYTLEYWDGAQWQSIDGQSRSPNAPEANYNRIQFPAISTSKIRAAFTHASGYKTGVKEIEAFNTGIDAPASTNQAPVVDARVVKNSAAGAELSGVVKDDGLPNGIISSHWEVVSAPENGNARFADASATSTTVTFNVEGDYVLKLSASDGELTGEKTLTVHGIPSDGMVNVAPQSTATASYTNGYQPADNAKVVVDGEVVFTNTPASTWNNWGDPHTTRQPWLQLSWDGTVSLKKANLYFWTDGGGVPATQSWKLQYQDSEGDWQDVVLKEGSSYTVKQNEGNVVEFAETISTSKLRAQFANDAVVGVSEFEAYASEPQQVETVARMVGVGTKAADLHLPDTVSAAYGDGSRVDLSVIWPTIEDSQLSADAQFTIAGKVIGAPAGTEATISVKSDAEAALSNGASNILDSQQTVYEGAANFTPPATVTGTYQNGGFNSGLKVEWDAARLEAVDLNTIGTYEVTGSVEGTTKTAKLIVQVIQNPNGTVDIDPLKGWIQERATSTTVSAEAGWAKAEGKLNDGVLIDDTWPTIDDADVNAKVWGSWGVAADDMYAEYMWSEAAVIDQARVQFWANFSTTDEDKGGLEIPDSWEIQYYDAESDSFKAVSDAEYTTVRNDPTHRASEEDGWSTAIFTPVTTTRLRLVLKPHLNSDATFGAAVAEWQVHAVSDESTVDKSPLESAVHAASGLEEGQYTAESWSLFEKALVVARNVLDDADATQESVDTALQSLNDAQKALSLKTVVSELQTAVDAAKALHSADYTAESYIAVASALERAEQVLADAGAAQEAIDSACEALKTAVAQLQAAPQQPDVDVTKLKAAVEAAVGLKESDYTADSWKGFAASLVHAQSVLSDANTKQSEVDAALAMLNAYTKALVLAVHRIDGGRVSVKAGGQITFTEPGAVSGYTSREITKAPAKGRAWLLSVHYSAAGASEGEYPFVVSYSMLDGSQIDVTYTPVVSVSGSDAPTTPGGSAMPGTTIIPKQDVTSAVSSDDAELSRTGAAVSIFVVIMLLTIVAGIIPLLIKHRRSE